MITHSKLPEAKREVEVHVKNCILKYVEGVIHTRKWVISVLMRNLVKTTVVNAQSKLAISLAHIRNWRAELVVVGSNQASLLCVFELYVKFIALRM
jgi:hypothetical protein